MGLIAYNLILFFYRVIARVSSPFNEKAKLLINGRRGLLEKLKNDFGDVHKPVIWIHAASLGEFEQARPVIEALRRKFDGHFILLTFFSPSGYEIRKDYDQVDLVSYLPFDGYRNSQRFFDIVKPSLILFAKYEFWYYYSAEAKTRGIEIISFSSIFRQNQIYFKSYASFQRTILRNFSKFFVQDQASKNLLSSIGIDDVDISGDTRFDRVTQVAENPEPIAALENLVDKSIIVLGSAWVDDVKIWLEFISNAPSDVCFIIVPHEVDESSLKQFEHLFQNSSERFSKLNVNEVPSVIIVDSIGLLSRIYKYAKIAYVGGALGKGLHNILEPAVFGIPVIFGNKNYMKFNEAVAMLESGAAYSVGSSEDVKKIAGRLLTDQDLYNTCGAKSAEYVNGNTGATEMVISYCKKILTN